MRWYYAVQGSLGMVCNYERMLLDLLSFLLTRSGREGRLEWRKGKVGEEAKGR